MDTLDWISIKDQMPPFKSTDYLYGSEKTTDLVEVKLDDGSESVGYFNDDSRRSTWLLKGTGGLFWVSWVRTVTHWRPKQNNNEK